MFYDSELQFLISVFKKSHLPIKIVSPSEPMDKLFDTDLDKLLGKPYPKDFTLKDRIGNLEASCMYMYTESYGLSYIYMLLPETPEEQILFIGPYVSFQPTPRHLLEIGEKNDIPTKNQKLFEMKFNGVSVLPDSSSLLVMLDSLCELIFKTPNFRTIEVEQDEKEKASATIPTGRKNDRFDEAMVKMENIEKRYGYENELMQAVALGHIHKIDHIFTNVPEHIFEKRVADPLRNKKNYMIIMNTLLRKAAEQGRVHPIYLDSISSSFALKIESLTSLADSTPLTQDMVKAYCRLVRTHSMRNYSPLVQKVITLIDSDLSANLTLSTIAKGQNVSSGYLCSLFKKETGTTVTEFIRDRRIKLACNLLRTTHLQIQTIAMHCGITDLQYFSKTFKKLVGLTPKEYRENAK